MRAESLRPDGGVLIVFGIVIVVVRGVVAVGGLLVDHTGVSFSGTKLGEPFSFTLPYSILYSLVIMTSTAKFALYVNGEFYEFTPERRSVGKMLLITEEMHRLHFNVWKNFPWNDWMYEGLELGIDAEKD